MPDFFLILAHPVYKMWITQEPKKIALWNKRHFEEKEKRRVCSKFKIFCTYICWIIYKMQHLEVSGAVRHVVRQLRVKTWRQDRTNVSTYSGIIMGNKDTSEWATNTVVATWLFNVYDLGNLICWTWFVCESNNKVTMKLDADFFRETNCACVR